jgi:hypothetical protein
MKNYWLEQSRIKNKNFYTIEFIDKIYNITILKPEKTNIQNHIYQCDPILSNFGHKTADLEVVFHSSQNHSLLNNFLSYCSSKMWSWKCTLKNYIKLQLTENYDLDELVFDSISTFPNFKNNDINITLKFYYSKVKYERIK